MTFSSAHRWQGFPYFALAALVFGAACSSEPTGTTPPSDVTQTSAADAVKPGGLVHQLGKGLAISLNDQAVRSWVKREIDRSPYVEQRIRLTKNLQELSSPEIKLLLDNAKLGSAGASDVRSVPELELYFPIASQLKACSGAGGRASEAGRDVHDLLA